MRHRGILYPTYLAGLVLIAGCFILLASCSSPSSKNSDTPNQGSVTIASDNTFQPIIEQELDIFGYDYPDTKIHCLFLPEHEIFKRILKDSIRFAVTSRVLTPDERTHFTSRKIEIYQNKVASDAIGIIINKENPDTSLLLSQIKDILSGKIHNWNELSSKSYNNLIRVILDQNGSSIQRTLLEKLGPSAMASKDIYSLNGDAAVAEYVSKNPGSMGFIGMNWLNNNDSVSTRLASKIHIMALSDSLDKDGKRRFYRPVQENIYSGKYPLSRTIYTLSVEGHTGLGTGFAVFLASDKGQLIFSKSGVLPVRGATREIHLN